MRVAEGVDCAGGEGDGLAFVEGPVTVTGDDPYGLDADGDGVGCEDGAPAPDSGLFGTGAAPADGAPTIAVEARRVDDEHSVAVVVQRGHNGEWHDVWSPGVRVVAKGDIGGAIIEAPAYPHGEIDAVIEAWVDDLERGRWLHAV